jgi:hypothetical protein
MFLLLDIYSCNKATITRELITPQLLSNELLDIKGFSEIINKGGKRFTPELSPIMNHESENKILPAEQDVISVTGGAKGIGFECARQLGIEAKCKLILIGRSDQ